MSSSASSLVAVDLSPKILFDSPGAILTSGQDLLRRSRIYSVLSSYGAAQTDVLLKVMGIWERVKKEMTASDFVSPIEKGLKEIAQINPSFEEAYPIDTSSMAKAAFCVDSLCQDHLYLSKPLIIRSSGGYRGTMIVNYPSIVTAPKDHVIKWVDQKEMDSTRIYQCFSKYMPNTFLVPQFVGVDLQKQSYTTAEGVTKPIEATLFQNVKLDYTRLTHLTVKKQDDSEDVNDTVSAEALMISEKVPGASLHDFILSKYPEMDATQKQVLFQKIANLFLLDLVLHFDDRIKVIKYDGDTGKYQLSSSASADSSSGDINFGNMMIDWKQGKNPDLYAIDNGIDEEEGKVDIKAYNAFLKEIFSKKDFKGLAQEMVAILEKGLTEEASDSDDEGAKASSSQAAELEPGEKIFLEDLHHYGAKAFEIGIVEMYYNLLKYYDQIIGKDLKSVLPDSILLDQVMSRSGSFQ